MKNCIQLLLFCFVFTLSISAQNRADSTLRPLTYKQVLKQNPYFNFFAKGKSPAISVRTTEGKENIFYLLAGLLLFLGIIRTLFSRYTTNLYNVFFNATLKQKQIREQMAQTPLPSLLFNLFFVIVLGIYATLLLQYYNTTMGLAFWQLVLYCTLAIGLIYIAKYIFLRFTGWVFNIPDLANTYIFIVFLINKMLGIFLLPFLIIMAFTPVTNMEIWITLTYILIFLSFIYRYFSSIAPLRREIKVNQLHFFLYFCAFEIAPLLLLYKVMLNFFETSV